MRFPWGSSERTATPGPSQDDPGAHACPGITKALARLSMFERPEILDVGAFCGSTAVYLAGQGARVSVEEITPPPPPEDGSEAPAAEPLRFEFEDERFHLVLAWEIIDFLPPERLRQFGKEAARILAPGGCLSLYSLNVTRQEPESGYPARFRMNDEGKILREPRNDLRLPRYAHPNREIEKALEPLSSQGIHLQRNQMREFLLLKKSATPRSSRAPRSAAPGTPVAD